MQAILSVTVPFFALVLCGYLAARTRAMPEAAIPGLNAFVLFFALPCMLFRFGAATPIGNLLNPTMLAVYAAAGLCIVALTILLTHGARVHLKDAAFGALVAAFPNTGFMGMPMMTALFGAAAAGPMMVTLLVGLAYENDKAPALNLGKRDSVTATAQYTLGASEFHVSVGYAGKWDNVPDSDAIQYTLGYNYNLSKRTKVYAFYYSIDNNKFAYGPGLADQTFSSIGLGIRHNF